MKNKTIEKYYLRFEPKAKVDYRLIINLYNIAIFNRGTQCFNKVIYSSLSQLANDIGTSTSKLNRVFSKEDYKIFFEIDKKNKTITLHNNFRKSKKPFVQLNRKEVEFLCGYNDNLLFKYYVYLKYYCGYSQDKKTDPTAKQVLNALGYSTSSSYIDKLSKYNKYIKEAGLLYIETYVDNKGHKRNIYSTQPPPQKYNYYYTDESDFHF